MADSPTERSRAISGSTPAGNASVRMPMNAAMHRASSWIEPTQVVQGGRQQMHRVAVGERVRAFDDALGRASTGVPA